MATNNENPRVLIVNDEKTIADTLAMILKSKGFDARSAYSAEQAIDIFTGREHASHHRD